MDKSLRPEVSTKETVMPVEAFQNDIIRPILKQKHDLIMLLFFNAIIKKKDLFLSLSFEKKVDFLVQFFKSNQQFSTFLKGVVIGQFTKEEYQTYINISSPVNKRIISLVKQRIESTF